MSLPILRLSTAGVVMPLSLVTDAYSKNRGLSHGDDI